MKSTTTRRFRQAYERLPATIQERADRAYELFENDPSHPSLRFKQVHQTKPIYSARISRQYRALGLFEGETIIWFWVGSHDEYEKLISNL